MKRRLFCALWGLIVGCSVLPAAAQVDATPAPLYAEKWEEVESYIRGGWMDYVEHKEPLPNPYSYALNPGTLYYYDLYFINEAMLKHGLAEQVRNNLDCFIFAIEQMGFVPNAYGWGESRSQMPMFAMSVRDYYTQSGDKEWLGRAYKAVLTEYEFWTNSDGNTIEDHSTSIEGLQRYSHHADTAELVEFHDRTLFYRFKLSREVPLEQKLTVAGHRLAECESMDFTPRYYGRCMDFIPVDLNANLVEYERNLAYFERELGLGSGAQWERRAQRRVKLINKHLWCEQRGMYMDYDFVGERFTDIACVMTLTPFCWDVVPEARKERLRASALEALEVECGITVCSESEEDMPYQFGRTGIWGSMQYWAMMGLYKAGFKEDARRVAMKYLNVVTKNYVDPFPAEYIPHKTTELVSRPSGELWEKYTHTGDINDNEYYCSPILGFTAAPYVLALEIVREVE